MQPDFPITDLLFQFTLLIGAVLLVQVALERIFIPGLLGLLVLGMLLGPGGAGVLEHEPVVDLFGTIGLVYIMFTAGLEIDLDIVRKHRAETFGFGAAAFGFSLALGTAAGFALGLEWTAALLVGTLLSSHTLVAYPMLERFGLLRKHPAVAAVGGTVLTDTLALVVLSVLLQTAGGGHGPFDRWWAPLLLLALLAGASVALLPRLTRALYAREWITSTERSLFALFVLLGLASAADLAGGETILGAFIAGLCLNRVLAAHEDTRRHVEFVGRMLFVPFFFVSTGMQLELQVLTGDLRVWGVAGLLCLAVVLGKSGAAWLIGARYGYRRNGRLLMIGLTLPQAAATLAISVAGQEAGLLDASIVDAVIIAILLTCAAGPLLTLFAARRIEEHPEAHGSAVNEPRV